MIPSSATPHEIRCIAAAAEVAPRTVRRYLGGEPIRPLSSMRIERALARLGRHELLRRAAPEGEAANG